MNPNYTKAELLELLENNNVEITFVKIDGQTRAMTCTRRKDVLPPVAETARSTRTPDHLIAVWSVKDNGWRSIRLAHIASVEVVDCD